MKSQVALVTYLDSSSEHKASASWFVRTFELELRFRGISTHEIACCLAIAFWV